MKIRITKGGGWYEDKVGEVFEVIDGREIGFEEYANDGEAYHVDHPENEAEIVSHFVNKEDCEIVEGKGPESLLWGRPYTYTPKQDSVNSSTNLFELYPNYYKDVTGLTEIDVYRVHQLFEIDDPSGAIHHASKKLLLSGSRTGGKSKYDDIKEARDTLTRWLELAKEGD